MNDGAVEHGISSVRGEGYVARCQLSALSRSVPVTAEREEEDGGGGEATPAVHSETEDRSHGCL